MALDQIKRDFARHRKKSAVLGVLALVMIGLFVKAWFDLHPRTAAASVDPALATPANDASANTEVAAVELPADAEAQIKESNELWRVLQEKRGMDVAAAFRFEPSYFPLDPNRRIEAAPESMKENVPTRPANADEIEKAARTNLYRDQLRQLAIRSTVVGNGTSRPIAVVNDHLLSIGDRISGFQITAIRAREVEFTKDGITLAVKMAEDTPVQ